MREPGGAGGRRTGMRLRIIASLLMVVAAACGSGDDPSVGAGDTTQPPVDGGDAATGAPVPGGALTVAEARATSLDDVLAVRGFIVVRDDDRFLCDALAESFPPQCGGERLRLEGLDLEQVDELRTEGPTSWTEDPVTVVGHVDGDVLRLDPRSA